MNGFDHESLVRRVNDHGMQRDNSRTSTRDSNRETYRDNDREMPRDNDHDEYRDSNRLPHRDNGRRRDHDHDHGHERHKKHTRACIVDTSEDITITTPVVLHAYVNDCDVRLTCGGHEIINESHCRRNTKKFKVRQKIHVHIPLEFVAECSIGEGQVDFDVQDV